MLNLFRRLRSRLGALLFIVSIPLLLLTSLLEPDGGGDGGDGGNGGAAGGGDGGAGDGAGGEGGEGGEGGGSSFRAPRDQAEFDRMVSDRIRRERSKFADYDELKGKATKFDELEAANRTELETEQAARQAAEAAAAAATANAEETLRRSAVLVAASKANAADPGDVYALLTKEQKDALTIGDDGQVTGAEDAVKALLGAKPHLVGKKQTSGSADGGTRDDGGDKPKTLEDAVNKRLAAG